MSTTRRFTAAVTREDSWHVAHGLEVEVASLEQAIELLREGEDGVAVHPTPMIAPVDVSA